MNLRNNTLLYRTSTTIPLLHDILQSTWSPMDVCNNTPGHCLLNVVLGFPHLDMFCYDPKTSPLYHRCLQCCIPPCIPHFSPHHAWGNLPLTPFQTSVLICSIRCSPIADPSASISSYTFNHTINAKDNAMPRHGPIYSLLEPKHTTLQEFIDDHLATGTIHLLQSPIGAPILFVKKKDGALHMVVDYRRLNTITWKDQYPLLHINNLLERLRKASIFTKIDLQNAYHLLCIKEGDE